MNELVRQIGEAAARGENAAVATVVRTKGSTPREVGARMMIRFDGSIEGTVGGGCGEAEVWSEAMQVLESGRPKLIEVDLLHDHDIEGGRACGGLMYVFIEPLVRADSDEEDQIDPLTVCVQQCTATKEASTPDAASSDPAVVKGGSARPAEDLSRASGRTPNDGL
jgi:xanthine/CO dehydrogenase XdhC/CoxF family maturation factor